jgi:hypothetical protein
MLGLGYRPLLVMLCLAPVRDDLLVAWGGRHFAAGECHKCRSKQANQGKPPKSSSGERRPALEISALVSG